MIVLLAGYDDAWLQLICSTKNVVGIVTQGRPQTEQWVTKYTIRVSTDGTTFFS